MTDKTEIDQDVAEIDAEIEKEIEEMDAAEIASDLEVDVLIPKMEVEVPREECLIGDAVLLSLYDEILNNCRADRTQTDGILMDFINMVMNDGESSPACKEAIVNLMKVKSDISDKMTKIADLETRIKLKETNTMPGFLAAQQNNKFVFDNKRSFLKKIEKLGKKKDDK